jgi:hypothetical protein
MAYLPLGRNAIGNQWVFQVESNLMNRFQTRVVAQSFNQRHGVDCHDTFSMEAKFISVRTVLALMTARGMHAHSAGIEIAFLNADL